MVFDAYPNAKSNLIQIMAAWLDLADFANRVGPGTTVKCVLDICGATIRIFDY